MAIISITLIIYDIFITQQYCFRGKRNFFDTREIIMLEVMGWQTGTKTLLFAE